MATIKFFHIPHTYVPVLVYPTLFNFSIATIYYLGVLEKTALVDTCRHAYIVGDIEFFLHPYCRHTYRWHHELCRLLDLYIYPTRNIVLRITLMGERSDKF